MFKVKLYGDTLQKIELDQLDTDSEDEDAQNEQKVC